MSVRLELTLEKVINIIMEFGCNMEVFLKRNLLLIFDGPITHPDTSNCIY